MRDHQRDYELMLIISPLQAHEEGVDAVLGRIEQTIEAEGGQMTAVNHSSPWGRRRLAYPIRAYAAGEASRRNFSEGYYVLLHFRLFASKVAELERVMRLTDSILRYLVTVIERKSDVLSADDESKDGMDEDLAAAFDNDDRDDEDTEDEDDEDENDEDEDDEDEDDEDIDREDLVSDDETIADTDTVEADTVDEER